MPEWHYVLGDPDPFEPKASDWGRLDDGRVVALDYPDPPSSSQENARDSIP